jgi:lactate dehydrogenase-like 2-hydroxyacid dehydrogenase
MPLLGTTDDEIQILSIPVQLRRCEREIRMLIEGTDTLSIHTPLTPETRPLHRPTALPSPIAD